MILNLLALLLGIGGWMFGWWLAGRTPTEDHHCFAGPIIEDRCAVCGRELP